MPAYTDSGTLTTATKSFDGPQVPDLTGLAYATNGETTTLTVVGSPGTAAEESHTVSLTGQTSVDLSWGEAHTEFELELALSTSDNAVSPTVDDLGLQSVTVAPAGLTATGEAGAVGLNWPAAPTATSYNVYRAEASGAGVADYALVGTTDSAGYVDDAVEDGERYYYRISGVSPDAGESALTDEAVATVPVSAPVLDALDASLREITLALTLPDDSTDGDLLIERSLDGASWAEHATIDDLSVTGWVDTGLLDGEVYHYRLVRRTDHAEAQSAVLDARTPLPAPIGAEVTGTGAESVALAWTPTANHGTQRVDYRRSDVGGSPGAWTTGVDGLVTGADSATVTGLRNGEEYDLRVVAETVDAETVDESPGAKQPGEYGGSRYGYYQYGGTA